MSYNTRYAYFSDKNIENQYKPCVLGVQWKRDFKLYYIYILVT